MIIIGVDYGDVRTGISVCDKTEMLASPVCVIEEKDAQTLAKKIKAICEEKKAQMIVMGLPKNMDSSEGFRAQACREFAELLKTETGLDVAMRDERLTTVSAHNVLNVTDVRGKKRKKIVDEVAAVMILQEYLDYRKNNPTEVK